MTEPGEQISSGYSVTRDDIGWQEYYKSFSGRFGRFDPYLGFTLAYKLEPRGGKPVYVVARPEFEQFLKTVVDQIVPAHSFLSEVIGDPGIEIIKISWTSPEDEIAYARYETGVGIRFSQKIVGDMLSRPVDARAAIVHELVHNYLDCQEKGETFTETVPLLFEIGYSVLHKERARILALEPRVEETGTGHRRQIEEAVAILKKKFPAMPARLPREEISGWLIANSSREEIISLLREEINRVE